MKKFKQLPLFYKIYFISLIVFLIALTIFSFTLTAIIRDYNKGIPETVSKKFFEETFLNTDTDKIINLAGITNSEFEKETDLKSYLENAFSGELSFTSISSASSDNTKNYIVKSGDYKIASFTLTPNEKNDYAPLDITLHLPKSFESEYHILKGGKLFINDIEVDEKYIIKTYPHKNSAFLPDGVASPEWVSYKVTGLTKKPSVYVIDRNGNKTDMTENGGIYTENIIYDKQEENIVSRVLAGAKQYAICMQNDASKSSVYPYFEQGTDLYKSIQSAENMFVWNHSGYALENVSVTEFMRYDENTVSMRISFTHVLKKYGKEDYKDITDITYFARDIGGKYYIFARYNN